MTTGAVPPACPSPVGVEAQTKHAGFLATFPDLALAIRDLVEAGAPRDQIMLAVRPPYALDWMWTAIGDEIDFLHACGRGGAQLRADLAPMSVDMAWST